MRQEIRMSRGKEVLSPFFSPGLSRAGLPSRHSPSDRGEHRCLGNEGETYLPEHPGEPERLVPVHRARERVRGGEAYPETEGDPGLRKTPRYDPGTYEGIVGCGGRRRPQGRSILRGGRGEASRIEDGPRIPSGVSGIAEG